MAVNRNDNNQPNSAMADALNKAGINQQQSQFQQAQPETRQQAPVGGQRSVLEIDRRLSRPMSRNTAGEAVLKFHTALKDVLEKDFDQQAVKDYRLLILDGPQNLLALSAVMVCFVANDAGTHHVAVHTLLVEASGGRLASKPLNIGGTHVESVTVAGDVYDNTMWARIEQQISETFGGRNLQIHDAGASVIPTELSVDDRQRLYSLLYFAGEAAYSTMDNALGGVQEPFNVGFVDSRDQLTARLDFSPLPAETASGLPLRSDIQITLQGVMAGNAQAQVEQTRDITRVDGFVDLVYAGPQQQPQQYGFQQPQQQDTRQYYPRFVMKQLASEVNAITMELQLLGLSTATLLSRNNAWAGVYRPDFARARSEDVDLRDIGAVGYEVNLTGDPSAKPDYIKTKVDSFQEPQLYQLLSATIFPNLIYSMDVEEAGVLSWINLAFIAAAEGKAGAIQMILEAADNLTMGQFSLAFPKGTPIAYDDQNRIHVGYYVDKSGQRRDLADIDYLAMLNILGKHDMSKVVEFADTFDRKDIPLPIRLDRRLKLLQSVLGDSLRIKGFARRITFNPQFIEALNVTCANAGLIIRPDNVANVFSGVGQRGQADIGQYAVQTNFSSGLFNYTTPGFGNAGRNYMGANLGRWSR